MFTLITREVFEPLLRRVGTAASAALVSLGASSGAADAVGLGIVAASGIAIDLLASHWARTRREAK